jgi:hypothetical protein
MQLRISVARMSLVGVLTLGVAACGTTTGRPHEASAEASDPETVDTGKRLSGYFVVSAAEDGYRINNVQNPQLTLSFDDKGNLKKQDRSRVEEGTYLIGSEHKLVMYIEKVNGEPLTAARIERYDLSDESGDTITLESPSRKLTLKKR